MIGNYELKEDCRFRCSTTSFGISAGHVIRVKQVDQESNMVLIDFGDNLVDWYGSSILLSKFKRI